MAISQRLVPVGSCTAAWNGLHTADHALAQGGVACAVNNLRPNIL